MESYYKESRQRVQQESKLTSTTLIIDRFNHSEQISERIEFMWYLATNSGNSTGLSIDYITRLWILLYENRIFPNDPQPLFKVFKEISGSKGAVRFFLKIIFLIK